MNNRHRIVSVQDAPSKGMREFFPKKAFHGRQQPFLTARTMMRSCQGGGEEGSFINNKCILC